MATAGYLGQANLRHLRGQLHQSPELFAGLEGEVNVALHNGKKRGHSYLLQLRFRGHPPGWLLHIPPAQQQQVSLPLTPQQRGFWQPPTLELLSPFPVTFFYRQLYLAPLPPLLVYPQPVAHAIALQDQTANQGSVASSRRLPGNDRLDGIRPYRPGDPWRQIHWRLSAREDQLHVKQLFADTAPSIWLTPDHWPLPLEASLEAAADRICRHLAAGYAVGLQLGQDTIHPATGGQQRRRLLTALARYECPAT